MTVDEAENCVTECELDEHTAFPPITNHVFHNVVFLNVSHEEIVTLFYENYQENFSFAHEFNFLKVIDQIIADQLHLFVFLASALLPAKSYDIIFAMVWEHLVKVQTLSLSSMVPRDG